MKKMEIEGLAKHVNDLVAVTPRESVLLTRNGKPFAFVTDASVYDDEDIGYMTDPEFWRMIRERRREKGGIPLEEVMARIEREEKAPRSRASIANVTTKKKGKR